MMKSNEPRKRVPLKPKGKLGIIGVFMLLFFGIASRLYQKVHKSNLFAQAVFANAVKIRGASNPALLMTVATYGYKDFALNLACSLKSAGYSDLSIFSLDRKIHFHALSRNVKSILYDVDKSGRQKHKTHHYGTASFNQTSLKKLSAVRSVLALGIDALFLDGDIYVCRNGLALEELASTAYSSESIVAGEIPPLLAVQRNHVEKEAMNSGAYYVRATSQTVEMFDKMIERAKNLGDRDDQSIFNEILCYGKDGRKISRPGQKKSQGCIWRNKVAASFLNTQRFPIGCTRVRGKHILEQEPSLAIEKCKEGAFALLHYSCARANTKKREIRARKMWSLDHNGVCVNPKGRNQ